MRAFRRFGKIGLTFALTVVFLAVSLLPKNTPPAYAAGGAAPPLPVPEDPLGQKPEQETPEISIDVDVRDGHLTVRVVDLWGPGRTPLVARSYTNTQSFSSSSSGLWEFNQQMDLFALGLGIRTREPDGNRALFNYNSTRWSADQRDRWDVYVKDIGTYGTTEIHSTCVPGPHDPPIEGPPGGNPAQSQGGRMPQIRPQPPPVPAPHDPPMEGAFGILARAVRTLLEVVRPTVHMDCVPDGIPMAYLPKGATRRYTGGLLQESRDANGNVTTLTGVTLPEAPWTYVGSVRDPVGRQTTYAYEPAYRECVREDPERFICLEWRTHYRVRTATDPYGRVATYTYTTWNALQSVTNGAGQTTAYWYDVAGRLRGVTNSRGQITWIEWTVLENAARVTRVIAPDTSATSYAYAFHPVTKQVTRTVVTNARGFATTYDFYAGEDQNYFGNLERVTDPLGTVTQYAYDARHNVTQVTDPRGNRTTYQYNSRNKVTQVVQAAGTLNLMTTFTWDGNDNLLSVTNPRGIRTDYAYDARHNLTHVRRAAGTVDESVMQYGYTPWGGVAGVMDPRGNTTSYTYTAGRLLASIIPPAGGTTTFGYDAVDNQVTRTDGNGRTWISGFDTKRLVTDVTDPSGNVVRYGYDANGNRTSVTDARNFTTWFAYDSRDRLTAITDPQSGQTRYAYDAVGNRTSITNAQNFATAFVYDAANRLMQAYDALGQITTFQYDPAGNRIQMFDRRGITHIYVYDAANRLTNVTAGGQMISYAYDANGNRLTMADSTGTTSYLYDSLDRQTRTTYPDGRAVQVTYDRAGNRTSLTYPDATTMTYAYDAANRLISQTLASLTWSFVYDAAGNRTQLNHPNGTTIAYTFLANNWLSSITHRDPGGSSFQSFSYTYDPNGNRTTQTDSTGTTTFAYDALNRLTSAAYPGDYGTWSWSYDPVGNRLQQIAPAGVTNYAYDANNRLTQAGTTTYAYDANGNLTSISTGQTFTWDAFNRMTQAAGPGGTATYTYNGDGLKVRRVGPDGTTLYYHDGIRSIYETDAEGNRLNQLDRDIFGNLLSWREASGARWYAHHDGLGSTAALTDPTGTVLFTMLYDAWGNLRTDAGLAYGKYRYTGAEVDAATGLYHMGARFYDSTLGRWLSEDPVQDKQFEPASLNFYTYVLNNPVLLVDPLGTDPFVDPTPEEEFQKALDKAKKEGERRGRQQVSERRFEEMARVISGLCGCSIEQVRKALTQVFGPPIPSADRIFSEGLYISGFVILGVVMVAEGLQLFLVRDTRSSMEYVMAVAMNPAITLSAYLLSGAVFFDLRSGGRVLSDFLRSIFRRR